MRGEVIRLLLNKPEGYKEEAKKIMDTILREDFSDDDILTQGTKLLRGPKYEWILIATQNVSEKAEGIYYDSHLVGISYPKSGLEIGDGYYYDRRIWYRLPVNYYLEPSGIYHKEEFITSNAVYPVSVLNIDNGRYPSVYKMKHLLGGDKTFIDDLSAPRYVSKPNLTKFREYVSLCIFFNSLSPITIETIEF